MKNVSSPITGNPATLIDSLDKEVLLEKYNSEIGIDVSVELSSVQKVELYQCPDTNYRFFHPQHIAGQGPFYEKLEKFPWYYSKEKWEYDIAEKYCQGKEDKILDIGCGEGLFLKKISTDLNEVQGLDFNEHAVQSGLKNGLKINNQTIEEHAQDNENKYDVVTAFQILEHIPNVKSFLDAATKTLKVGGKLIIAVPNNEPYYLTYDRYHTMNWPPHHMCWWDKASLEDLSKTFPIKPMHIEKQTLSYYNSYTNIYIREKHNDSIVGKVLKPFYKLFFYLNRKNINGASILAVYEKTE